MVLKCLRYHDSVRTAVLISGSLRSFQLTWTDNLKILSKTLNEFDVYFHTWSKNFETFKPYLEAKYPNKFHWSLIPKRFVPEVNVDLNDFFGKRDGLIKVHQEDFDIFLESFPPLNLDKSLYDYQSFLNSYAMYYGMQNVAEQAINSKVEYSNFLRVRADFQLNRNFHLNEDLDFVFCAGGVYIDGFFVSDQCFYGKFSNIERCMFGFDFLQLKVKESGWIDPRNNRKLRSENVLFEHMKFSGLIELAVRLPSKMWGEINRGRETRDYDLTFWQNQLSLFRHNKLIFWKKVMLYSSRLSRIFRLTKFLKKFINFS